jgi:hypothetical protein
MAKKKQKDYYTRIAMLKLDFVINVLKDYLINPRKYKEGKYEFIPGIRTNIKSLRLKTFAVKGTSCSKCGIQATHFAIENNHRNLDTDRGEYSGYHLNMWAIKDGEEILMTHDHTIARGLGGEDGINNTSTMCHDCNTKKAVEESREAQRRRNEVKCLMDTAP